MIKPLASFLLSVITTVVAILFGFDADKSLSPVLWQAVAGLGIGLFDPKPRASIVVAGVAAFPLVVFLNEAVFGEIGNVWPIAMTVIGVIAAIPFLLAYALALFVRRLLPKTRSTHPDVLD